VEPVWQFVGACVALVTVFALLCVCQMSRDETKMRCVSGNIKLKLLLLPSCCTPSLPTYIRRPAEEANISRYLESDASYCVVMGPKGSGKSTIVDYLMSKWQGFSIAVTIGTSFKFGDIHKVVLQRMGDEKQILSENHLEDIFKSYKCATGMFPLLVLRINVTDAKLEDERLIGANCSKFVKIFSCDEKTKVCRGIIEVSSFTAGLAAKYAERERAKLVCVGDLTEEQAFEFSNLQTTDRHECRHPLTLKQFLDPAANRADFWTDQAEEARHCWERFEESLEEFNKKEVVEQAIMATLAAEFDTGVPIDGGLMSSIEHFANHKLIFHDTRHLKFASRLLHEQGKIRYNLSATTTTTTTTTTTPTTTPTPTPTPA
jgi:hypothetical protein